MPRIVLFAFLAVLAVWPSYAQDRLESWGCPPEPSRSERITDRGEREILTPGARWDLLGEGYHLTADSAVDKDGNIYFTDADRNRILKVDLEGKISVWKEGSNRSHGVTFGPDGRLYAGQHDPKRIVAFAADGAESVIAEGAQTHHLTATSRNHIYFAVGPAHQVRLVDAGGRIRVAHEGIRWPRGVRAEQSRLLVGDAESRCVWSFQIQADGSLTNGQPFYRLQTPAGSSEPDSGGMVFDTEGFLYVATKLGVQVCDPSGRVVAIIDPPGSEGLSNVFFGGRNLQWLYVTDGAKLYRRPAKRRGAGLWSPVKPQPRR